MVSGFTKHAVRVRQARELTDLIPHAFALAASGRQGPVLIDVPRDVQLETTVIERWPSPGERGAPPRPHAGSIARAAAMIDAARRPVLYVGGGVRHAGAAAFARDLAHKACIPAVVTLMAQGVFPSSDRSCLGLPGMHGEYATNLILGRSDCIIAIGTRFDDRATSPSDLISPQAKLIHIDIDPAEINKVRPSSCPITADARAALAMLVPRVSARSRSSWQGEIATIRQAHPPQLDERAPLGVIAAIGEAAGTDTLVTTDVGQHQLWTTQAFPFQHAGQLITSGGFGTMGFGLPAAIGCALMHPDKTVLCFTGDGSLLMNIQELATLAELGCNVKVFILDNGHLGLVRQQQALFHHGRITAARFEKPTDYLAIARSFGLPAGSLPRNDDLATCLQTRGPFIFVLPVDEGAMALPMVPPGASLHVCIGGAPSGQVSPCTEGARL